MSKCQMCGNYETARKIESEDGTVAILCLACRSAEAEEERVDEALRLAELEGQLCDEAESEQRQDLVRALLAPLREGGMGRPSGGVAEAIEEEAALWARGSDDRDALLERRARGGSQRVLDAIDALVDALEVTT